MSKEKVGSAILTIAPADDEYAELAHRQGYLDSRTLDAEVYGAFIDLLRNKKAITGSEISRLLMEYGYAATETTNFYAKARTGRLIATITAQGGFRQSEKLVWTKYKSQYIFYLVTEGQVPETEIGEAMTRIDEHLRQARNRKTTNTSNS